MKCYKHGDKDTIWTCKYCSVWLCKDCFNQFTIPVCDKCNLKALNLDIKNYYTDIIKYFLIWSLVSLFYVYQITNERNFSFNMEWYLKIFFITYFTIFVWFWWSFLNSLKDPNTIEIVVNESIISLIMKKVIKLAFSCIIWGFVWPYRLYKIIKEIKSTKKTIQYIENNNK